MSSCGFSTTSAKRSDEPFVWRFARDIASQIWLNLRHVRLIDTARFAVRPRRARRAEATRCNQRDGWNDSSRILWSRCSPRRCFGTQEVTDSRDRTYAPGSQEVVLVSVCARPRAFRKGLSSFVMTGVPPQGIGRGTPSRRIGDFASCRSFSRRMPTSVRSLTRPAAVGCDTANISSTSLAETIGWLNKRSSNASPFGLRRPSDVEMRSRSRSRRERISIARSVASVAVCAMPSTKNATHSSHSPSSRMACRRST